MATKKISRTSEDDLIGYSAGIKLEADELLIKHKLIENLSRLGNVEVVGSYKLNLMWQKDIDLYITTESFPDFNNIIEFINKSFSSSDFYYQKYEDNSRLVKPNLPRGIGLFIKLYSGWKLDIWFLSKEEAEEKESQTQALLKDVDENTRTQILRLKMESINAGVYNKKFTSFDLYNACANNDIEKVSKYLD